jgi:cob(I)alamin adenosyltransferase
MVRTEAKVKPLWVGLRAQKALSPRAGPGYSLTMSITTKTGDDGSTGLWSGERVAKDHPRIEICGDIDELSSLLGLARLAARLPETGAALEALQRDLVRLGGELASLDPAFTNPIQSWDEEALTEKIRALEVSIPLLGFVLPGRTEASARIDLARTVARRVERRVVALARGIPVSDILRRYLNRLSDYLFMLARSEEAAEGKIEYV